MQLEHDSLSSKIQSFIDRNISELTAPVIQVKGAVIKIDDIVIKKDNDEYQVTRDFKTMASFDYRSWAVAFSLAIKSNKTLLATKILDNQRMIRKLTADIENYNRCAKRATVLTRKYTLEDRISKASADIMQLQSATQQAIKSYPLV